MDQINGQWFWAAIIGFLVGAIVVWLINNGNKDDDEEQYEKLRKEYDRYRTDVNSHFVKTANAIDNLNKSYQEVLNHLGDGAKNLMDNKALQKEMQKRRGKTITISYLSSANKQKDNDFVDLSDAPQEPSEITIEKRDDEALQVVKSRIKED